MEQPEFKQYRRISIAELRPITEEEIARYHRNPFGLGFRISISKADIDNGSPRMGDMVARNPKDHDDIWLVSEQYFTDNFEPINS